MLKRRLLFFSSALLVFGLLFISVSSSAEASYTLGDKLYFIKKQLLWSGVGTIVFSVFAFFGIKRLPKISSYLYFASLILLTILFLPNLANLTLGARRWLDLGIVGVQPSEIAKLASITFFAYIFSTETQRQISKLIKYLLPIVGLIIIEPNLSTAALITATIISIYYLAGGEIISLFSLSIVGLILGVILIFISPYRKARLDPNSYHTRQMITTITSGHIFGKGFANSDQKYRYLPKISTDSILAIIGEETGFIGITLIIYLYLGLISTISLIGQQSNNLFQYLFCQGIALWIAFQTLINMAAVSSLIPLTGVPLPLISYGGSSLLIFMAALGLVYSVNVSPDQNHLHHRSTSHPRHRINSATSRR